MRVAGLQGSPRKKGNTDYLLDRFLEQAAFWGAETVKVPVAQKNILPCIGCNSCMKTGECVIQTDDMFNEIYALLQKADVIVAATPVFFYGPSAQLKALIDRSQALWSRKYALKIPDARAKTRKGFLLSVGATSGKQLFEGITLTAKYFFDAAGAAYGGSLTFRKVDQAGDLKNVSGHLKKIAASARQLFEKADPA
jgi:arsenate reductase (thioredoxin)